MEIGDAIVALQTDIQKLNDVFTPQQFEKLFEILSPILVLLHDIAESHEELNKIVTDHWKAIHFIAEQGKFDLSEK